MVFKRIIAAATAAVITMGCLLAPQAQAVTLMETMYRQRYAALESALKSDEETLAAVDKLDTAVVFMSVSDGKQQARICQTASDTLDDALEKAYEAIHTSGMYPKYLRLDVAVSEKQISYKNFQGEFQSALAGSFRYGVSFNGFYGAALLEAQINANGMLNYEDGTFDWQRVNKELIRMGKTRLSIVPKKLYLFKAQGYFCDNGGFAYKLRNGQYNDTGRRDFGIDRDSIALLAARSSSYLSSLCDNTGKFIYGYYPVDNEEMPDYNILRHGGAAWNLIMQYEMTGDERLVPVIESSLAYLRNSVVYKDRTTAFIKDSSALNVGGNGLALLAYSTYALTFGSTKYNSLIQALANGVLYMQKEDGSFTHLIFPETYEVAKDYVIVYYDGEAAFGLMKAYEVLGQTKYLNAVCKAADCFIENNYETLNSHWIAYMFNELTKYKHDEKYFEFGLKNIMENDWLRKLYNSRASRNSSNETLNSTFELYDRLIQGGYKCDYLEQFDAELLIDTLFRRADNGLNYFMFPECSMFFKAPDTLTNSFSVREDAFRTRIDDIQHFMDGYYLYWKNYDRIMQYKEQTEQEENNKAA